ncbi:MAG: DUF1467 family protein [Alcanivorax sp.]
MSPVSAIVVFIMIWWTVIFCVLPLGLSNTQETADEEGEYIAPGAPKKVDIKKKFILTTIISFILWAIIVGLIQTNIIDFRELAAHME